MQINKQYCPIPSDAGFSVEHKKVTSIINMNADHYHDYYEIYFFLGNEMKYFVRNRSYKVKRFDILFIDKFTYHRTLYNENSPIERILINFDQSLLDIIGNSNVRNRIAEMFQMRKLSFSDNFSRYLCDNFMHKILPAYCETNSETCILRAKLLFLHLLLEIAETFEKHTVYEDSGNQTPKEKRVAEVVEFINSNYMQKLTLDDISKNFFVNKFYLCHIFKEITGVSIVEYIVNKRMHEAEKLLIYSGESITMISETVGFRNVNNFISAFKEKYGCTPKNFRSQISNKNNHL